MFFVSFLISFCSFFFSLIFFSAFLFVRYWFVFLFGRFVLFFLGSFRWFSVFTIFVFFFLPWFFFQRIFLLRFYSSFKTLSFWSCFLLLKVNIVGLVGLFCLCLGFSTVFTGFLGISRAFYEVMVCSSRLIQPKETKQQIHLDLLLSIGYPFVGGTGAIDFPLLSANNKNSSKHSTPLQKKHKTPNT